MRARATTTISVLRTPDGAADAFGDPVDTDIPVATGIPASIILRAVRQYLPAENRTTVIQSATCRVRGDLDIRETDRIRDDKTGEIYTIELLYQPQSYAALQPLRLELKKTT